jgi:hypothetical protein
MRYVPTGTTRLFRGNYRLRVLQTLLMPILGVGRVCVFQVLVDRHPCLGAIGVALIVPWQRTGVVCV